MANYISPLPETKGNTINVPHFYENNNITAVRSYQTMGDMDLGIPSVHSVAQTYEQNEKLKEIMSKNLF
ncbi:hypothetical protein [Clostridium sp.]|jgi:hypothetical protein|uniref:hypothetical protein n=1 Tax=Clostridium sp. TaxID=1506 RepID=UPI0039F46ECE